jgi:predicted aspartyl protease
LAKIIGSVDDRRHPVVRLEMDGHSLLMVVDTGFNGDLLLSQQASMVLSITSAGRTRTIELGDGTSAELRQTIISIPWLGAKRAVRALIADSWMPRGDDPIGLVGTELVSPNLLMIDFSARTVDIETQ